MNRAASIALGLLVLATACSSSTSTVDPATPTPNTEVDAGAQATSTGFKTYVILGDSISDTGGVGPYFYDLLATDLKGKFGDIAVVKKSQSGAVSAQLPGQVKVLPKTLEGPVAVSVTIGGNDMQAASLEVIEGTDGPKREAFAENLAKAYDELTTEGRFGEGVKVTIFHATIYDPSDGEGNFSEAGCPGYLGAIPKQPTKKFWDAWNQSAADAIAKYGSSVVTVGMREAFEGHGVGHLKDGTSWFAYDCIHPNKAGHEAIRKLFFGAIAP